MQKVMVVDQEKAKMIDFNKPKDALREVYQNFFFSPQKERNNCVVRAAIDVKGQERGGPVDYLDFKASVNPILYHVKRILHESGVKFSDVKLVSVRVEENNIIFKFDVE
jgi:hypothetical protein